MALSNIPPGYSDEGDVPANGKDTAIYQELVDLRAKVENWKKVNRNDFANDDQIVKADHIVELIDELADELGENF